MFLKILLYSHESICVGVSLESLCLFLQACNFVKKETLAQVFSCEFCEISKNTFFTEHLRWLLLIILCMIFGHQMKFNVSCLKSNRLIWNTKLFQSWPNFRLKVLTSSFIKGITSFFSCILFIRTLHKKWSFQLRISSVNVTKSAVSCRFGRIYWRIFNGKLHILCKEPVTFTWGWFS